MRKLAVFLIFACAAFAAEEGGAAKHEGGDPEVDVTRAHLSDILDYFRSRKEVLESGDWANLQLNYLDKVDACNRTAWALTEKGLSFIAAKNLHK